MIEPLLTGADEPSRRLSYTWNVRYDPERAGEAPSLVTWEIEPQGDTCSGKWC